MAKKDSLHLHKLIQSLTKHEKAYFARFSKQHASKQTEYIKLFYALEKMKQYDEQALRQQFANLPFLKSYLFDLILNALSGYYNNPRHPQIYMLSNYAHAYILEKKGFVKMAAKALQHGIQMAAVKGNHIFQYILIQSQHRQQSLLVDPVQRDVYFKETIEQLNGLLKKEQQSLRYLFEFDKVKLLYAKMSQGLPFDADIANIDIELLLNVDDGAGSRDRRLCYETLIIFFNAVGKDKDAYLISHKYLQFEKKILLQPGNDMEYYSRSLMFAAISNSNINKKVEAQKHLEIMNRLRPENKQVDNLNRVRYITTKLNLFCEQKEYSIGSKFTLEAMKNYPQYFETDKPHFQGFNILGYMLLLFFFDNRFDMCIRLLNHTDMNNVRHNSPSLFKDMEILRLMLQIEMGNHDLLESMIHSMQEKFKKNKMLDEHTKLLLKYFRYFSKGHIQQKEQEAILKSLRSITEIPHHKFLYKFMGIMPYEEYIKGHSGY